MLAAALVMALPLLSLAQTTPSVGIGTTAPDVSAALDIVSSSKGALLPRVASTAAVATPATGLLVFQTGAPAGFYYNAGTPTAPSWQQLNVVGGTGDNLGNHSATQNLGLNGFDLRLRIAEDAVHGLGYYGTINANKPWNGFNVDGPVLYGFTGGVLGINNGTQQSVLAWNATGKVGIGTTSPAARLDLQGGADNNGSSDPVALAFSWRAGGYRHFVRSRHNNVVSGGGNALDFYLNTSGTAAGSSAPGTGNVQVLTLESNNGAPRVGIGTTTPNASAVLDVSSTTKGLLPPRMTNAQRDAINPAATAAGLTIYNTTTGVLNTWDGTKWVAALVDTSPPTSVTFAYTGGPQTYTVPAGITALTVDLAGASGGPKISSTTGQGLGGRVQATLAVTPGQVLTILVGGAGAANVAGYNGGGSASGGDGGGGGASDIRTGGTALTNRVLVAGGGGGGGDDGAGGAGGGLTGATGGTNGNGGGGGGSSYAGSGTSAVQHTQAYQSSNGYVTLTGNAIAAPVLDASNFVNLSWSQSGSSLYPTLLSSNVGIGTSSPTQALDVRGNVRLGNNGNALGVGSAIELVGPSVNSDVLGLYRANVASNVSELRMVLGDDVGRSSGDKFVVGTTDAYDGPDQLLSGTFTPHFTVLSGGSVGIGTTTPAQELDVVGSAAVSGSVGIGTTTPAQKLDVVGSATVRGSVGIGTTSPATTLDVRTANASAAITVGQTDNTAGALYFGNPSHGVKRNYSATNDVGLYTTAANVYLSANGTSTSQFVLTNAANVGIGTTPSAKLHLAGNMKIDGFNTLEFGAGVPGKEANAGKIGYRAFSTDALDIVGAGTGSNRVIRFYAENGASFNGAVNAQAFNNNSDARFKQHVRPLTSALAGVLSLRGVRYDWNALGVAHGGQAGAEQVGLIAQELEQVYPELVHTDADGYKSVNYAQLTPVLIEALKEQQAQIEALKQQNAALKAEATATTDAFEARLRALEGVGGQARK